MRKKAAKILVFLLALILLFALTACESAPDNVHDDDTITEDDLFGVFFLADTYSFETTLRLTETRVSVEEIFDKSYEELRSEWIAWISR